MKQRLLPASWSSCSAATAASHATTSHAATAATAASAAATASAATTAAALTASPALDVTARVYRSDTRDDIGLLPRLRDFHENENRDQHHHHDYNNRDCWTNLLTHALHLLSPQQPLATIVVSRAGLLPIPIVLSYHDHAGRCDFQRKKQAYNALFRPIPRRRSLRYPGSAEYSTGFGLCQA